jgi:hypothetical protein
MTLKEQIKALAVEVGYAACGQTPIAVFLAATSNWRRWKRNAATGTVPAPRVQPTAWMALMILAVVAVCLGPVALGMMAFFLAQVLPRSNPAPGQAE